jgi:hypothetical protein
MGYAMTIAHEGIRPGLDLSQNGKKRGQLPKREKPGHIRK